MLILFRLSQTWPITLTIQNQVFSGCTVLPHNKETELGNSDQEASPLTGKSTGIDLVPCNVWKCVPTAISSGVEISKVPGCHFLQLMSSQNYFKDWCLLNSAHLSVFNLCLTQSIKAILSKACKPDNFEPHNSLKLSFTNIWGRPSNFVQCESSLNQTLLTFLLYVRHTWMTQLILAISLWGVIFP